MAYFHRQDHIGCFDKDAPNILTGTAGTPRSGDVVTLSIQIDPTTQTIIDAKFKAHGSVATIAACALATERLKGLSLNDAKTQITATTLLEKLQLPRTKRHTTLLVEDALTHALF